MTPREIDATVAEKVLGWTPKTFNKGYSVGEWTDYRDSSGTWTGFYPESFRPTELISHAWMAFESLGPGWQISQSDPSGYEDCFRWWCWLPVEMGGKEPVDRECETMAPTAPMAICLAALKAVGVSEEDN